MTYRIPLAKIYQSFHPAIFSNMIKLPIEHYSLVQTQHNYNKEKSLTPSFYTSLLEQLNFQPIEVQEVTDIILSKNYELIENSHNEKSISRLNHIKSIASFMICFNEQHFISAQVLPSNLDKQYCYLDINTIEDFYLLAATIFRNELNLPLDILNNEVHFQFKDITLEELIIYEDKNKLGIETEKEALNTIPLNPLQLFQWDIDSSPPTEELNLQYIVNQKIHNDEPLEDIFEQLSLKNDLHLIYSLSTNNPGFFEDYFQYHYKKHLNLQQTLAPKEFKENKFLMQKTFLIDFVNSCSQDTLLLSHIWSSKIVIALPSLYYPQQQYNQHFSFQTLYAYSAEKLTDEFMLSYKKYHYGYQKEDGYNLEEFIRDRLFPFWAEDPITHVDFDNFKQVEDYVFKEFNYREEQVQQLTQYIRNIYQTSIFHHADKSLLFFKYNNEKTDVFPTLDSFNFKQEKLFQFYDTFLASKNASQNTNKQNIVSLTDLCHIPSHYLSSQHDTNNVKQNNYLFALINTIKNLVEQETELGILPQESIYKNTLTQLFDNVFDFNNTEQSISIVKNYISSTVLENSAKFHNNNFIEHSKILINHILTKNPDIIKDLDLCTDFWKKSKTFFSTLGKCCVEQHVDYDFIFHYDEKNSDVEQKIVEAINKDFSDCIFHPKYPLRWKTNYDILLHNKKLSEVHFTTEELNNLFSDEKTGYKLIRYEKSFYEKLPTHFQEVPTYAKAFIQASDKDFKYTFKPILFQYHDFCISLIQKDNSYAINIPLEHWSNQHFIQELFKKVDDNLIRYDILKEFLPIQIKSFFEHFEIKDAFSPFLESYILQQKINHSIENKLTHSIENKISNNINQHSDTIKIKKKKL